MNLEEQLTLALAQESPQNAKRLALPILDAAEARGDAALLARSLACVAECDLILCAYRESQSMATRAAHMFETLGDADREAHALSIVARAASALGRNEAAVEAALLAVELARQAQSPLTTCVSLSELGLALGYSRSFAAARAALEEAEAIACANGLPLEQLVALARQGTCELIRMVALRHETGRLPATDDIDTLLGRWAHFKGRHDMTALAAPDQRPIQIFLELLTALFHCWRADLDKAHHALQVVHSSLSDAAMASWTPWMDPFRALVDYELTIACNDLALAERHAAQLMEVGQKTKHEQFALLGHLLRCHAFERLGHPARALQESKAMVARERSIRAESLASRSEVVGWKLGMRRSEHSRKELQASARHLQKLSSEDPLTGIANRRHFEAEVKAALLQDDAKAGRGVCLALLDVDHFKQVNDQHGHVVGDKVLQVVAALLVQHVRDQDLAARLAGDEFVVLFRGIDTRAAWDICERLRAALNLYPWQDIAAGLRVSVSVGVAQSEPGDVLESLVERSDVAMYARKKEFHRMP